MEDGIFKERQNREIRFKAQNKAKRRRERIEQESKGPAWLPQTGEFAPQVRPKFYEKKIVLRRIQGLALYSLRF